MKEQKKQASVDKFLVGGVILLVILLFFSKILPPSPTQESVKNEILLKRQIEERDKVIKGLKEKNQDLTESYEKERDSLISNTKVIHNQVIVYREAVEATDLRPDSINLLNEVRIGRKVIASQEGHINALLALSLKADSLLGLRLEIIQEQEGQIQDWSNRFSNMVAQKDNLIKQERKRGHKKFIKGALLGSVVTLILVVM